MTERIGDWQETYSGIKFYPLDPRPEDIEIEDIARSLSKQCRFLGHIRADRFYSVAEHCVHVSNACLYGLPYDYEDVGRLYQMSLTGLLHDAAEAYIGDIPAPLKRSLAITNEWHEIEMAITMLIMDKFGGLFPVPYQVKDFDRRILVNERAAFLNPSKNEWRTDSLEPVALPIAMQGWTPDQAYLEFMKVFEKLTSQVHYYCS